MKLIPAERETIINFCDGDDNCNIYTCNSSLIRKMDKLVNSFPEVYVLNEVFEGGKSYNFDKKYVSVRSPKILSEKQKAQLSDARKKQAQNV